MKWKDLSFEDGENFLDRTFGWFSDLLMDFDTDTWNSTATDKEIIATFVSKYQPEGIRQTIAEGKKLLAMPIDYFPAGWIRNSTCFRRPSITENGKEIFLESTKENYYNWVKQTVETLEAEAKRQGKL